MLMSVRYIFIDTNTHLVIFHLNLKKVHFQVYMGAFTNDVNQERGGDQPKLTRGDFKERKSARLSRKG